MKVITICGSLKFKDQMLQISEQLTLEGACVLTPVFNIAKSPLTGEELKNLKEAHFKRIELSDAIYVVNVDNYIGTSTANEIEHAKKLGKEIIYYV